MVILKHLIVAVTKPKVDGFQVACFLSRTPIFNWYMAQ
jgi:hypothetical protein